MTRTARTLFLALAFTTVSASAPLASAATITEYPLTPASTPKGITLGPDGNIWFVEKTGNKIGVATPNGVVNEYPLSKAGSQPQQIAVGVDGALYFTEPGVQQKAMFRLFENAGVTEFPAEPDILSLTSGPWGSFWYTRGTDTVSWFDTGFYGSGVGCTYTQLGKTHIFVGIANGMNNTETLWLTDPGANEIVALSKNSGGCIWTSYPLPNGFSEPNFITLGRDGAIWFTERLGNRIGRIYNGVVTEFPLPAGSAPEMITASPDGTLWFTEPGTNRIGRITHNGTITHHDIPTPNSGPYGVAVGIDGSIWFTEQNASKLGRLRLVPPGDVNADGGVNVSDVLYLINFLFAGGPAPK